MAQEKIPLDNINKNENFAVLQDSKVLQDNKVLQEVKREINKLLCKWFENVMCEDVGGYMIKDNIISTYCQIFYCYEGDIAIEFFDYEENKNKYKKFQDEISYTIETIQSYINHYIEEEIKVIKCVDDYSIIKSKILEQIKNDIKIGVGFCKHINMPYIYNKLNDDNDVCDSNC